MTYYDRQQATHIDGSPIFATEQDKSAEDAVAVQVEREWGCEIRRFGALSPVDWFATRSGRVIGVLEVKSRSHPSTKYATVYLNVRKWLALTLASVGMGVPALYLVQFSDGVRWCRVADVDASRIKVGGCAEIVKSRSDIEPVIEVPVGLMRPLRADRRTEVAV